jgi:hypothetical protein
LAVVELKPPQQQQQQQVAAGPAQQLLQLAGLPATGGSRAACLGASCWLVRQAPAQLQQQLVHPAAAALRWEMMVCQAAHLAAVGGLLQLLLQRGSQKGTSLCRRVMQRMLKMTMLMMMCCLLKMAGKQQQQE